MSHIQLNPATKNAKAHIELRKPDITIELVDEMGAPRTIELVIDVAPMDIKERINGAFVSLTKAQAIDLMRRLERSIDRYTQAEKKAEEFATNLHYK